MDFSKFAPPAVVTRLGKVNTAPPKTQKTDKVTPDKENTNNSIPKPQREARKEKKAKNSTPEVRDGTIIANKPASSLISPAQSTRSMYAKIINGALALLLIIDPTIAKSRVGVYNGPLVFYDSTQAIASFRSKNDREGSLVGYAALSSSCKELVDRLVMLAAQGEDLSKCPLAVDDQALSSFVVTDPTTSSSDVVDESVEDPEQVNLSNEAADYVDDEAQGYSIPNYQIHRRGRMDSRFSELMALMVVEDILRCIDHSPTDNVFAVMVDDEVEHFNFPSLVSPILISSLEQWKKLNRSNVEYLHNLQACLDIALYEGMIATSWFCHIDDDGTLILWTAGN